MIMERNKKEVFKDVSVWVIDREKEKGKEEGEGEKEGRLEGVLEKVVREACCGVWVNGFLGLEEGEEEGGGGERGEGGSLVSRVEYKQGSRYVPNNNDNNNGANECYRVYFDSLISNMQAKALEKKIREKLKNNPIEGMELR